MRACYSKYSRQFQFRPKPLMDFNEKVGVLYL